MAEPLRITFETNLGSVREELAEVRDDAGRGVQLPVRGRGAATAGVGRGGTAPPVSTAGPVANVVQNEIDAALARGDVRAARAMGAQYNLPVPEVMTLTPSQQRAAERFDTRYENRLASDAAAADRARSQNAARADRSFDAAAFAQQKQGDRNEERFQRNLDSANLALQRSREREAAAAQRNAEREERRGQREAARTGERTSRAQMDLEASRATTPEERAAVYRRYAEQQGDGSPEQLRLLARAERAGRTREDEEPGMFNSRFGRLVGSLYLARYGLEQLSRPFILARQGEIQREGGDLGEQVQQSLAAANAEFSDPLRYAAQKGLAAYRAGAGSWWHRALGFASPALGAVASLGQRDPDDDLRLAQEAQRQFQAQTTAREVAERAARLGDVRKAIGLPDFSQGAQLAENQYQIAKREADKLREQGKGVSGNDALLLNQRADELEKAAKDVRDAQIRDLSDKSTLGTRVLNLQTAAQRDLLTGHLLQGHLGEIEAKFAPIRVNGRVVGFGSNVFQDAQGKRLGGTSDQDYNNFQGMLNAFRLQQDAAGLDERRRLSLLQTSHEAAVLTLNRNPLGAAASSVAGQAAAALIGVDDPETIRLVHQAARDQVAQAALQRADQIQLIGINQRTRGQQLASLLSHNRTSAETFGIIGETRSEEARLRQAGLSEQADTARRLGIKQLELQKQEYLESFSAVQVGKDFAFGLRRKQGEDPSEILKNIQNGIQGLGTPGTVATAKDVPELLQQLIDTVKELPTYLTN